MNTFRNFSRSAGILSFGWAMVSVMVHPLPDRGSGGDALPMLAGSRITRPAADALGRACVNCHSERTFWPWYSHVAPASWLIESDVKRGREHLNLSRWEKLDPDEQRILLTDIATVIENKEMPPRQYLLLHSEAKLSAAEAQEIIEWTRTERRRLRTPTVSFASK